jgi:hypothetical protein
MGNMGRSIGNGAGRGGGKILRRSNVQSAQYGHGWETAIKCEDDMKHLSLCAVLLLVLLCSCEDVGGPSGPGDLGTFNFIARDSSGTPVMRGILVLHADSTKITGSWQLDNGRSGALEGSTSDGMMYLNLNPGWVDNNLILHGTMTWNVYSGEWEQIGFAGVMAGGTFVAIKK